MSCLWLQSFTDWSLENTYWNSTCGKEVSQMPYLWLQSFTKWSLEKTYQISTYKKCLVLSAPPHFCTVQINQQNCFFQIYLHDHFHVTPAYSQKISSKISKICFGKKISMQDSFLITLTVRNKWEKLELIGKVIFDIPFMIQTHTDSMKKYLK